MRHINNFAIQKICVLNVRLPMNAKLAKAAATEETATTKKPACVGVR